MTTATATSLDRNEAISRIKKALRSRSGKAWSVTGGRGTDWGWITITAPPARRIDGGSMMTEEDRAELAKLLGKTDVHHQGENVPASSAYRREFVDRAEGRTPSVCGEQYWD